MLTYYPAANEELEHAIRDYEAVDPELADALIDAILAAESEIEEAPFRFALSEDAPIGFSVHDRSLQKFKFRLIYVVEGDEILVLAFAHLHRQPGYWHERL